ncbi:MAG: hypothetical protein MJZ15_08395 [Bacteroidales bacterium]|nr:hypothetical protein [Bacteroidales bacterium]
MANKRDLKKGIGYWTDDLITTIYYKNAVEGTNNEKAAELIVRAARIKSEFIARANHIDKKSDRKAVKAFFRQFDDDFVAEVQAVTEEINKL